MDAVTWTSEEWLAGARAWLDEQLAAAGVERRGEVTQPRVRAWGTVLRADTTKGPVWLKHPGRRRSSKYDKLVLRPRDAYLSVFGEPADLLEELDLACWIGKVARSLVWGRALHGDPGRFIDVPLEILGTLKMNSWRDPA